MYLVRILLAAALSLSVLPVSAVDLNQASAAELRQIKGIGPKTAESILAERERAGPFDSLQDLSDRVKGIGPKRVSGLEAAGLKVGVSAPEKNTSRSAAPKENN